MRRLYRRGHFEVWRAEADVSSPAQVTRDGVNAENPTATPDGSWIVYATSNPAHPGLWKIRPDGSAATELVPGYVLHPEISPDGRQVAYHTADHRGAILHLVGLDPGAPARFLVELGKSGPSSGRTRWFPDGRGLATVAEGEPGRFGVVAYDFDPSAVLGARRPLPGLDGAEPVESFAIAPDGARLTISSIDLAWAVMVADGVEGVSPAAARER